MGKFYSNSISSSDPTTRINSLSEWFNNIEGISSEVIDYEYNDVEYTAAKITIDNTPIEVLYGVKTLDYNVSIIHAKNGDISLVDDTSKGYGTTSNIYLYAYVHEDKAVLISVGTPSDTLAASNCIELLYVKTNDNTGLIGYKYHADNNSFVDISSMTFENIDDTSRAQYTYANMFQYTADAPYFDFLSEAYFKNSLNYKSFTSNVLKECSTISLLATASLPDPLGQHIAIGAHCVVPVDVEEEVGE